MTGNLINTVRKRRLLTPRKAPYWYAFRRGASIGLYVGATKQEWCARAKDPTGAYRYTTLGTPDDTTYEEAETKARAFADLTARNERPNYTVADAIADYVEDAKVRNGETSAKGIRQRLARSVPPELADRRLSDLRTLEVKRWRDSMVRDDGDPEEVRRSKDNSNRVFAMFKAALNLAFRSGYAASDGEWRRVTAFRDVDSSRRLFLTPEQVQCLLTAADGAFRDLLKAGVFTGARYGELIAAKVRDFDPKSGTLHLSGKTGPRTCYLSREASAFFRTLLRDKLPDAFLLMRDDGNPWGKSHQHRPMRAAVDAAGLPRETVFYSLRHYHISRALLAAMPAQVIAENCGTSVRMIEKHYGKFTRADRRRMLDLVQL